MDSNEPGESRRRLDEACNAMATCNEQIKRECDALEALLDAPGAGAGQLDRAYHLVRAAGMRGMGLTTVYLAELHRHQTGRVTP